MAFLRSAPRQTDVLAYQIISLYHRTISQMGKATVGAITMVLVRRMGLQGARAKLLVLYAGIQARLIRDPENGLERSPLLHQLCPFLSQCSTQ